MENNKQITNQIVINLDNHIIKYLSNKYNKTMLDLINEYKGIFIDCGILSIDRIDEQLNHENYYLIEFIPDSLLSNLPLLIYDNKDFFCESDEDYESLKHYHIIYNTVESDLEIGNHKPIEIYMQMLISLSLHKSGKLPRD